MAKKLGINTMDKIVLDRKAMIREMEEEIEREKERLEIKKQNLIEKEEIRNFEVLDLSNHLKELKEQRDWISSEIIKTQLKLNKLCTHERIKEEYRNYSGGYLDRAEHWTDYFCEICGEKVDEKVEYGGFG